ncbi:PREDICTED: uncharacterized protein LOC105447804 [Wasmannia auropunctata]|uniref:uncharacterized protein LOC105447804 n=1 Tax=Wasmannia auropunctata TaxID=64793 RepID=UPI0005EDC8AE|nr:PREDICTED: uncharacterized protein LOC105447804 [Wasmannia auropunctata]
MDPPEESWTKLPIIAIIAKDSSFEKAKAKLKDAKLLTDFDKDSDVRADMLKRSRKRRARVSISSCDEQEFDGTQIQLDPFPNPPQTINSKNILINTYKGKKEKGNNSDYASNSRSVNLQQDAYILRIFSAYAQDIFLISPLYAQNQKIFSEHTQNIQMLSGTFDEGYMKPIPKKSSASLDNSILASTPVKSMLKRSKTVPSTLNEMSEMLPSHDESYAPFVEKIFKIANEPLVTSVRNQLQTSEGQEKLQMHYGTKISGYGPKRNEGTKLGNKRITLDKNDNIIIDGKSYAETPGLYELIFICYPNEAVYTDDDLQKYQSILLTTNAYRRDPSAQGQIMGNKGHNLRNIFNEIPSIQTLQLVLHKIPLSPGLNPFILKHLKSIALKMPIKDKVCILIWDEVSIQPKLTYDIRKDIICGLEDWGNNRTGKIADHALVFMLRGLNSGWKMPISYNFCSKQTNTAQLIRCIKEHVKEIVNTGFHIVATVCDQGSSNVAAIKELLLRTDMNRNFQNRARRQTFEIEDTEIIPLYDPPHLIKGIRNNLLTKDLIFNWKDNKPDKIASWDVIKTAWIIDRKINTIRPLLKKLTAEHIIEDKIKKMRVKHATQVLSGTMASAIETLTRSNCVVTIEDKELRINIEEGIATAETVNFFNDLFDSVNGDDKKTDNNELRCPVMENSNHHEFWVTAKNSSRVLLRAGLPGDDTGRSPVSRPIDDDRVETPSTRLVSGSEDQTTKEPTTAKGYPGLAVHLTEASPGDTANSRTNSGAFVGKRVGVACESGSPASSTGNTNASADPGLPSSGDGTSTPAGSTGTRQGITRGPTPLTTGQEARQQGAGGSALGAHKNHQHAASSPVA